MSDCVKVANFHDLMSGYQKSSMDCTRMPGLAFYLKQIIEQQEYTNRLLVALVDDTFREDKP